MLKLVYFAMALLVSCSLTKDRQRSQPLMDTVVVNKTSESKSTLISMPEYYESLDQYGPVIHTEPSLKKLKESSNREVDFEERVVGVALYPALYKSVLYLKVLAGLEERKSRPSILMSCGFPSVLTVLYAKYGNINETQWKYDELYGLLDKTKIHTGEWYREIREFLEEEFGNLKVSQLRLLTILPSFDEDKRKLSINTGESVVKAVMTSVKLERNSCLLFPGSFKPEVMSDYGADFIAAFAYRAKGLSLARQNDFVLGVYARVFSQLQFDENILVIDSQQLDDPLDEYDDLPTMIHQYEGSIKDVTEKAFLKLKKEPSLGL